MNILIVIYSLHGGGAEKTVRTLLERFDRSTFSLSVCVLGRDALPMPGLLPPDVHVYSAATALRPASIGLIVNLARIIRRSRPDRILSFMWGANIIAVIAGMITRTPVVISERIVTSADLCWYTFSSARKKIISLLYRHARTIIAVSTAVRQDLIESFCLPAARIEVIHNGIDSSPERLQERSAPPFPQPYIISCGRLVQQKNHLFLIEALAATQKARQVPLVILGQGPLEQTLKYRAAALQVKLILPGFIDNPAPWIKHASIFTLTSSYEGFPNVVLEAMAAGTPVIALDTPGGIRELVQHERTGLLLQPGDQAGFAAAIDRLLADAPLSAALATAAQHHVTDHFSVSHMVKQYQDVLSSTFIRRHGKERVCAE
jgi:N-acetylgalactosamine-N,N'-diacetylbacillosaminyl-diphospho-undecaprenol 4-alpha-N-acetylgalactosaminyltransferase